MTDETPKDEADAPLTDERIITGRREALRRLGGAAAAVAFGGLAAACGSGTSSSTSTTAAGSAPAGAPASGGHVLWFGVGQL